MSHSIAWLISAERSPRPPPAGHTDVLAELAGKNAAARKVHDSYMAFRERTAAWSRISIKAVLEARDG